MKSGYLAVCVVATISGLFAWVVPTNLENDVYTQQHFEKKAMNSLGYRIVTRTAAYPEDRFAMPEPYSSEQLVTYAMRIQEYKSKFAEFNFNSD